MNWVLLQNSLWVSLGSTVCAAGLGVGVALWLAQARPWARRWGLGATALVLALPSFLIAGCWMRLWGTDSPWRAWAPVSLYSLGGTVWLLALTLWPLTTLWVYAAWQRLEPSWIESDPALRDSALCRWVLLPVAWPELRSALAVTFVLALNNFSIPALLQVKVYPAELWVGFNTTLNSAEAMKLSWPMVLLPLLLLWALRGRTVAWPRWDGGLRAEVLRRRLGRGWRWGSGCVGVGALALGLVLPLAELVFAPGTWRDLGPAWAAGRAAFGNSFWLAAGTASLCVAAGVWGWRWLPARWVWIPFLTPGVVLGVGLLSVIHRGPWYVLSRTSAVVFLAWFIRYLAPGLAGAKAARQGVDPDLTDWSRLEGATRWGLLRHVHWPQMAAPLAAAWYVVYLLCLWDVESLILVVPPGGETLALRIFNLLHYGHNSQVNALCLGLLALALLPGLLWLVWHRVALRPLAMVALVPWLGTGCGPVSSATDAPLQSRLFAKAQVLGTRGTGVGQFNKPRSLAVDGADNLYVVDMTGRVQRFDTNGAYVGYWQMEQTTKGKPKGMDVDARGDIVVVEPHYTRVNHLSPDLKSIRSWGNPGTNAGQLAFPRSVAVNTRGELVVSEYSLVERVQRFSPDGGRFLGAFGKPGDGPGEFNRAEGVSTDAQDRVYVADSCNHRIQVFSREGKFLYRYGHAGGRLGELSYPYDVKVDAAGRQYVCEFGNSRIQVFDATGKPLETIGRQGGEPGEFFNPWSIALDSAGNLYVADANNHRVQKLVRRVPEANRRVFPPPARAENGRAKPAVGRKGAA